MLKEFDYVYDAVLSKGIAKIQNEYGEQNNRYMDIALKKARNCGVEILEGINAFFVPNPEFLVEIFGDIVKEPMFDMYDKIGQCKYIHKIVIPIYTVNDEIIACTAYDPVQTLLARDIANLENIINRTEEQEKQLDKFYEKKGLKYLLPAKSRLRLSNYLYCPKGTWDNIFRDNYVVVVDGMFDCIMLNRSGINAVALMGSEVSSVRMFMLNMVTTVFVFYDNDTSGLHVLQRITKSHPNAIAIKNRKTDDADNYIKLYGISDLKSEIDKRIKWKIKSPIVLKG